MKKFNGIIIHGDKKGREIGFPTINIQTETKLEEEYQFGVYACKAWIDGRLIYGIGHFGPRLIFDETKPQLEIHLFEFNEDVYGKEVEFEIGQFIRSSKKFNSMQEMKAAINEDVKIARSILLS